MAVALYLLTSDGLPDLGDQAELLVLDAEDEGARTSDGVGRRTGRHACVTTLMADYEDLEALRHDVRVWWLEIANAHPSLELLTTEPSVMSTEYRDSVAKLEPRSWSIRTPLVVYRKSQPGAAQEARRLVTATALRDACTAPEAPDSLFSA